ncbi:hypothetical protein DXG01_003161 [Tephrocybe rancida]|nr:hypothetical protein DXG01_003161 [Tephrocybe rancida]
MSLTLELNSILRAPAGVRDTLLNGQEFTGRLNERGLPRLDFESFEKCWRHRGAPIKYTGRRLQTLSTLRYSLDRRPNQRGCSAWDKERSGAGPELWAARSLPAWCHTRPICTLAARIVTEDDSTVVTLLTIADFVDKCRFEVARQLEGSETTSPQRVRFVKPFVIDLLHAHSWLPVRVVSIVGPTNVDVLAAIALFAQSYLLAYKALAAGKSITCSTTGTLSQGIIPPVAVIIDQLGVLSVKATRAVTGKSIPIICWVTGGAATFVRLWGPQSIGGIGNMRAKIQSEAQRTGRPELEVGDELYQPMNGAVVRLPGVPAMYDYEFNPQKMMGELPMARLVEAGDKTWQGSDALLFATPETYEKDALDGIRAWQSEEQKKLVHVIGPLLPFIGTSTASDVDNRNSNVAAFLDAVLHKHGKHSLIFISFGSMFWPSNAGHIEEVIDAVIEKKTPFVSLASLYFYHEDLKVFPADFYLWVKFGSSLSGIAGEDSGFRTRLIDVMGSPTVYFEPSSS